MRLQNVVDLINVGFTEVVPKLQNAAIDAFIVPRIKSRYVAGFAHAHLLVEKNVE